MNIKLLIRLAGILLLAGNLMADTMSWTNSAGGKFDVGANWDSDVPGSSDAVLFDLDSTGYTVSNVPSGTVNQRLSVVKDKVTLDLTGTDYTLTESTPLQLGADGADGHLTFLNGELRTKSANFYVAHTTYNATVAEQGTLIFDGTKLTWPDDPSVTPVGQIRVGNVGKGFGHVVFRGGAKAEQDRGINNLRTYGGTDAAGSCTITITDPGTIINARRLELGYATSSNFNTPSLCIVTNGASLKTAIQDSIIGRFGPGILIVTGTNSVVQLMNLAPVALTIGVGSTGWGLIRVQDGGTVNLGPSYDTAMQETSFGNGNKSRGSLLVEDADSLFRVDKFDTSKSVYFRTNSTVVVRNNGTVSSLYGAKLIFEQGSFLGGDGTMAIDIDFGGTLKPGGTLANDGWYDVTSGTGTLSIEGDLTMGVTAGIEIEIGNNGEYDRIDLDGDVTLAGTLSVELIDGFSYADTSAKYTILESTGTLSGSFSNVANGEWIETANPNESFQVHYGPDSRFDSNDVILTPFPKGSMFIIR